MAVVEDEAKFYGIVTLVVLSMVSTTVILCWSNQIPQTTFKAFASCFKHRHRYNGNQNQEQRPSTQNHPGSPSNQHAMTITEVDDFNIQESVVDEVEIFLAEVQHTAAPRSLASPSTLARKEFLSNLLIRKRVVAMPESSDKEPITASGYKGKLVLALASETDLENRRDNTTQQDQEVMQCAICLVEYQEGDTVCFSHNRKCEHHYHQICISSWLLQDRNDCPCCRNNYLALSDDEDEQRASRNGESEGDADVNNIQPTAPSEDDWVPSYLAPLYISSRDVDPQFHPRIANTESQGSLPAWSQIGLNHVQAGQWTDEEDALEGERDQDNQDAWSCPSVEDCPQELVAAYPRPIPRRRRGPNSQQQQQQNHPNIDGTRSLELGDLIVENLMQRLKSREDERSAHTGSSSSLYTEGSDIERGRIDADNKPQHAGESELCAICRHEYAVNEELCWSQDPSCAHVFHRRCMQQWILGGNDYCPFCNLQSAENGLENNSSTGEPHLNVTSNIQAQAIHESTVDLQALSVSDITDAYTNKVPSGPSQRMESL